MAATRDHVESYYYGDTASYDTANVEIYRAQNADGIYRYYARQATENILQQLTDEGYIGGYTVTTWNTDFSLSDCTDTWDEWHNFRENNTNWDSDGAHLLVHACGSGQLGAGAPVQTWTQDGSAHARTNGNDRPEDGFKHTVAMEVLHSFVASRNCCDVQALTGPDNKEHSLGTVLTINRTKVATPLSAKGTWDVGECSYDQDYKEDITMLLSRCTKDAMRYSADHADGRHSDSC